MFEFWCIVAALLFSSFGCFLIGLTVVQSPWVQLTLILMGALLSMAFGGALALWLML